MSNLQESLRTLRLSRLPCLTLSLKSPLPHSERQLPGFFFNTIGDGDFSAPTRPSQDSCNFSCYVSPIAVCIKHVAIAKIKHYFHSYM